MASNINNRYPRPLGVTSLMVEYHRSENEEALDKIRSYMINQWLLSNGQICGKTIEILALAKFLDCDPETIRVQMRDNFLSSKVWDKDHQEEMLNALMGTQLVWALEDRMEVDRQLNLLKTSQGDSFKPFVTAEVNKAISLKLSSSTNLQSILKSMQGGGSINIFNQVNTQNNQNQFLTKEEAMKMIQDGNQKLLDSKKETLYIEAHHNIAELPEVIATKQQGISQDSAVSHINPTELKAITDIYSKDDPEALPAPKETRHDTRRAQLLGIDLDSESE